MEAAIAAPIDRRVPEFEAALRFYSIPAERGMGRAAINHTTGKYKPASRFPCRKQKPMDLSLEASRLFQYLLRAE